MGEQQYQEYDTAYENDKNVYQQPSYQPYYNEDVGVLNWLITIIILGIPCIGFIMTFLWAFGASKKSKRNYMRAQLILMVIWIVIIAVAFICFSGQLNDILYKVQDGLQQIQTQLPSA